MTQVLHHATTGASTAAAARVENGVKVYGVGDAAVTALDDVTLSFGTGRFTAIMGPSGSGKSTLLHCAAGLDTLDAGRAFVGDVQLDTLSDRRLTKVRRDRIGFVFQAFNLVPTLDARENILLPLRLGGGRVDQMWFDTVVETVGLASRLSHRPAQLSGGQQQRVAVARALVTRPDVIFADEPTGNLDSRSGEEVLRFLRAAVDEFDRTIVMVTHDPVAASWADEVVFLVDGHLAGAIPDPTREAVLERLATLGS